MFRPGRVVVGAGYDDRPAHSNALNSAHGTGFQWTLYNEPALTASGVVSDLTYINQHYGSDPDFLHVNGKPVVFVYTRAVAS